MKCAIMQPTYMPWIGYFSMIDKVDTFVFLDDVQLVKRSWQVRNKIKSNDNELLLSIPVAKDKERINRFINNTSYNDDLEWKAEHLKSIKHSYSKSKYFDEVYPFIDRLYKKKHVSLAKFNIEVIESVCQKVGIDTGLVSSSSLIKEQGNKDSLLANICESINANYYLSAQGSADYIEQNNPGGEFTKRKIDLYYHMYNHPNYNQLGGKFISHIGIYDLLFNEGFDNALAIIRSGNQKDLFYLNYRNKYMQNNEGEKNEDI